MKYFLYILIIVSFYSCKKKEERHCWKSTGEMSEIRVELPEFSKIRLMKKLEFKLVQDDSNYMLVKGGENLIQLVKFIESGVDEIEIYNENKCNFLRNLKLKIEVEIHFKNLTDITFIGSEKLTNKGVLNFDNLYLLLINCSGSVNLSLNVNNLTCENSEGYSDYTIKGNAQNANLEIRANAFADCSGLVVENNLEVYNKSFGDFYINATNANLSGYISSSGNIYYKGIPISNSLEMYSTGKLISY